MFSQGEGMNGTYKVQLGWKEVISPTTTAIKKKGMWFIFHKPVAGGTYGKKDEETSHKET